MPHPSDQPQPRRVPDSRSELHLLELKRTARQAGVLEMPGIHPSGGPIPLPKAERGYYGVPLLKEPQWNPAIPIYFFVGGAGGAAAVLARDATLNGAKRELVRDARTIAAVAALLSPALLVADLGRPERFLYMLRVFKPRSAMSVGVYIVSCFSTFACAAKAAELAQKQFPNAFFRAVENAAGIGAALFGLGMASYTGVLIGATSVPVWSRNVGTLPVHFAMSGLNSAVGTLELMGHTDSRALNLLGMAASTFETVEVAAIERRRGEAATDPLRKGISGLIVRAGGVLSGPLPLLLRSIACFAGRERATRLRKAAAISGLTGSLLTRFGWVRAGHASAKDYRVPLQLAPGQEALPDRSRP